MTEEIERFYNYLINFFDSYCRRNKAVWFLDGNTLAEFVCNMRLIGKINIGMIKTNANDLIQACEKYNYPTKYINKKIQIKINKIPVYVKINKKIDKNIICMSDEKVDKLRRRDNTVSLAGTWRYNISLLHWYNFPIPYKFGTYLDKTMPLWFKNVNYLERTTKGFFNKERSENAIELIYELQKCAKMAKFEDYIFLGFGSLLGIIRENSFIGEDHDLDHCILGNKITFQQEELFLREAHKKKTIISKRWNEAKRKYEKKAKEYEHGLFEGRKKPVERRSDNNRFLWTSCGHKHIKAEKGVKSCLWKMFLYKNMIWHSKGSRWISPRKFRGRVTIDYTEEAIAKGIKAKYLENFIKMDFKGLTINVPELAGSCLDFWYPGWARPKPEKSSSDILMIIPKWIEPKTWYRI